MCAAVESSCESTVGKNAFMKIFTQMSSLVTDGTSANTGEKGGLWTIMECMRKENSNSEAQRAPLLKIWCCVHRSNLAWHSVSDSVSDVSHIFQHLIGMCTFFRKSGLRSRELHDMAEKYGLHLMKLPKVFEVRWTEFTSNLLNAILSSWNVLVLFFQNSEEKSASGFLRFLTNIDTLELIAFLADTLTVFSRYQQQLQSDSVTILDMDKLTANVKVKLNSLKATPLLGGWVATLQEQMVQSEEDLEMYLKDVKLQKKARRATERNKFVTEGRENAAVKIEIIDSLLEFLTQRFAVDEEHLAIIKAFGTLQPDADLKAMHAAFCTDVDLEKLGLEYGDLMEMDNIDAFRKKPLRDVVLSLAQSEHYLTVNTVLACILAAKPHSADVERLISSSNTLKTSDRSSMHFGHREYVPVRVLQHATFICVGSKTSCFIVAQQAPPPSNRQA